MPLQQLFTSRKPYNAETFVGQEGKIFYDEVTGLFRLGDGNTPGGKVVGNLAIASTGTNPPINPYEGELWYNPSTKELWAYHDGSFRGTINLATSSTLGGVRLGPGVVLNAQDQIIIDSSGLDFNFGNFNALTLTYPVGHPKEGEEFAVLQTLNTNEDAVLASNGTGAVKIVGEFAIFPANGSVEGSMLELPVLSVTSDGDISAKSIDIQETGDLGLVAALNVTLNEVGLTKTPAVVSGSIAQFTGRDNRTGLLVVDTYGVDTTRTLTGGEFVFRTGRGSNSTTTSVLSGDRLGEITAAGWASNGYGGLGVGGMRILAAENFTSTARGSKLEFYTVTSGTLTTTTVYTVDSNGIALSSGKTLTGNINATTVTATNITVTGNINGNLSGTTVTANSFVGTVITPAQPNITSVGTLTNLSVSGTVSATTGTFTKFSGKFVRATRDAGTIGAGGTLTIDFTTDAVVYCVWGDGMTINYQNYLPGSVVKVIARKATGTGVDTISLDGITVSHTSNGSATSGNYSADTTAFIEFTCVGTTIGTVYAKF